MAVTAVVTLPAAGEAPALEAQLAFHLHAGAAAVVVGDDGLADGARGIVERFAGDGRARLVAADAMTRVATEELGADWVLPVRSDEFWWPRGARYDEILSRVPAEFDVALALVRPFLRVEGDPPLPFTPSIYRLAAQAYANEPDAALRPQRRLAHRAGVEIGEYSGEIVASALKPLRGWYPIEVLWFPQADPQPESAIEEGLERGVVQLDTRLRDMLAALRAGERPELPRPSVVDNAWYAVDAAVLGEADAFRIRKELDALERRLADLEEHFLVRVDRKLRSVLRRGRREP